MKKKAIRKAIGIVVFIVLVILISFAGFGGPTGNVVDEGFGRNYGNSDFVLSLDNAGLSGSNLEVDYKVVELGGESRNLNVNYEIYGADGVYAEGEREINVGAGDIGSYSLVAKVGRSVPEGASLIFEVSQGDKKSVVVQGLSSEDSIFRGGVVSGDRRLVSSYFLIFVLALGLMFYVTRMVMERGDAVEGWKSKHDKHLISVHR